MEPSDSQLRVIKYIKKNLDINFEGKTKEEARLFISEHMDKSKESSVIKTERWDKINQSKYKGSSKRSCAYGDDWGERGDFGGLGSLDSLDRF